MNINDRVSVGTAIIILVLIIYAAYYMSVSAGLAACQKKHSNNLVKIIDEKCHYKNDFGWIESGKAVYPLKKGQYL